MSLDKRLFVSVLLLLLTGFLMRAQVFPSNEEVNRILSEGRAEELLQLKQQILDEQAKCDSSSVEHHVWNFMLLQTYTRLQDLDGLMLVVKDLYMYISSGGDILLAEVRGESPESIRCSIGSAYISFLYYEGEDYESAERIGIECLPFLEKVSKFDYYRVLHIIAGSQNMLKKNDLAYSNIKRCYSEFKDTPDEDGRVLRQGINQVYYDVLRDLAIEASNHGNTKKVRQYVNDARQIQNDYPGSFIFNTDFLITLVSGLPKNAKKTEINSILNSFLDYQYANNNAKQVGVDFVSEAEYNVTSNLNVANEAINQGNERAAEVFIERALEASKRAGVPEDLKLSTQDCLAVFYVSCKKDIPKAMAIWEDIVPKLQATDHYGLSETYSNIVNAVELATWAVRYFYARPQDGTSVYPFDTVESVLISWEAIGNRIISFHGQGYFNSLIYQCHHLPANQRVFSLYSLQDAQLMRGHNYVRAHNYKKAFSIIGDLVKDNKLSDSQLQDIIWRIDNNLYLRTDYSSAKSFLMEVQNSELLRGKNSILAWVDGEINRLDNWPDYAINYGSSLFEQNKIDDALAWFDVIDKQVLQMKDAGYLLSVSTFYRAYGLKNAQLYKEAIPYYIKAESLLQENSVNDFSLNHLTFNGLGFCYWNEEQWAKALQAFQSDCQYVEHYNGDTGALDYENEWYVAHKRQGDVLTKLGDFDSAVSLFQSILSRLEKRGVSHDNNDYIDTAYWVVQSYYEASKKAYSMGDDSFLSYYYKAASFMGKHKDIGELFYDCFAPFDDFTKDIINSLTDDALALFCDTEYNLYKESLDYALSQGKITKEQWIWQIDAILRMLSQACSDSGHIKQSISLQETQVAIIHENEVPFKKYILEHKDSFDKDLADVQIASLPIVYGSLSDDYQELGEWVNAVENSIKAYKSSIEYFDIYHNKPLQYFLSARTLVNISTNASVSYANVFQDKDNPRLTYDENIRIFNLWKNLLSQIKEEYGSDYIDYLQEACFKASQESYKQQFGVEMPYLADAHLALDSEIIYKECLLNIQNNRMADYMGSYNLLLSQIKPIIDEDIDYLRYHLVTSMSKSLTEAGYAEWGVNVLEGYWNFLVSEKNQNFELAEKIQTQIGFDAWNLQDMDRFVWAIYDAKLVFEDKELNKYRWLYYDVNELITRLMLYSRGEAFSDRNKARKILQLAEDIVDRKFVCRNGKLVDDHTKALLYNEIAVTTSSRREAIDYYEKVLNLHREGNETTRINLALEYTRMGDYSKSDSLLTTVLDYYSERYLQPKWKASIYKNLAYNSSKTNNSEANHRYTRELLSNQVNDYLRTSQSLTSALRSNYWDFNYSNTLEDIASFDILGGPDGSNSYNAALFQKSILIRQKRVIKENILHSNDKELIEVFERYNNEVRSMSDSAYMTESNVMYLYALHPEFVSTFTIPTWQEVQSKLKKNELAIEYAVATNNESGDKDYVAILLRYDYNNPIIIRLCAKQDLLTASMSHTDSNGFSMGLYEDNSVLYNLLWQPIEPYLKGVKTIFYAPYEHLNNVNVEIAAKKHGGKSLGDMYKMYRVSSTSILTNDSSDTINHAVIFGDIDYNSQITSHLPSSAERQRKEINEYANIRGSMGGRSWRHLDNTKAEIESVSRLLSSSGVFTEVYALDKGTEDAFKSISGQAPDILHLATHGFYYSKEEAEGERSDIRQFIESTNRTTTNSEVRSGLILSGGNHAWKGESIPVDAENGILTANEINGMDLSGNQLLVLSACQTGLGDIGSDGVYGLQRSFKVAGVDTIIMSLWKVHDEATYLFMNSFYSYLTKGMNKHDAFNASRKDIKKWAEKTHIPMLMEEVKNITDPRRKEKVMAKYEGALCPEYYYAAFVMLD